MLQIDLDRDWDIPIVKVILGGVQKKTARGALVFDTGSAVTQIDVELIETLGYSARDAVGTSTVKGATGEAVQGYLLPMSSLFLFGIQFRDVMVLTYDFKNFPGVDGLLGWNIIQTLHLEMHGRQGWLKIFDQ